MEKRVKAWNRNRRAAQSRNGLSPTGRRALTAHGKVDEKLENRGQNRRGDKADEHSALNLAHVQDDGQTKANNEDQGRPSLQGAVNTKLNRGCACTNNARVDQAHQGNKKTDTYRDSGLDLVRDCAEDRVSEPCQNEKGNEDTFPEDQAHGFLEAQARTKDQGEGNDCIQAKTCSQCQRVVRNNTHEDGHDTGDKCGACSNSCGGNGAVLRQSG